MSRKSVINTGNIRYLTAQVFEKDKSARNQLKLVILTLECFRDSYMVNMI